MPVTDSGTTYRPPSRPSTVYGPVNSWRVGSSLGIDLLYVNSICSFRCVYCQLGKINVHTAKRDVFVPTAVVMEDLQASNWRAADIITFSGNGEPTLAANIGEVMQQTKQLTGKPILVLTNSAHLNDPTVRAEIRIAEKIFCKLDAVDDQTLRWIDRPVEGITVETIVAGITALRCEYDGFLAIQTMLTRINQHRLGAFAEVLKRIRPDEVQLNVALRPIPADWDVETRGDHSREEGKFLKSPTREEVCVIQNELARLSGIKVVSRYQC